jgi:lipopolysaccharide biosynthesis protein
MENSTAILVHIWYEDVFLDKIYPRIVQHNGSVDFYFNFVKSNISSTCVETIQKSFNNYKITYSENPGRDIRGYMNMLSEIYKEDKNYKNYIFLHTKTNIDSFGVACLETLLLSTVGTVKTLQTVQNILEESQEYGMVGSATMFASGFYTEGERSKSLNIADRLGIQKDKVNFIAGTMFAVKAEIIDKFLRKPGVIERFCKDFVEDGIKHSGWHHAWERVFGMLVYDCGQKILPYDRSTQER